MIWYTSDYHFNHLNIIKYSARPFANEAVMDEWLVLNTNKCVLPGDTLYFLGDWAFPRGKDFNAVARHYRDRIACRNVVFVWGNHDNRKAPDNALPRIFNGCHDILEVADGGRTIVLCHYAMRVWDKSFHGSWHFYGHSHGTLPAAPGSMSLDVGVDAAARHLGPALRPEHYRPLCLADVETIFAGGTPPRPGVSAGGGEPR